MNGEGEGEATPRGWGLPPGLSHSGLRMNSSRLVPLRRTATGVTARPPKSHSGNFSMVSGWPGPDRTSRTGRAAGLELVAMQKPPDVAIQSTCRGDPPAPSRNWGATEIEIPTLADDVGPMPGSAAAGQASSRPKRMMPDRAIGAEMPAALGPLPEKVNSPEENDFPKLRPSCVILLQLPCASQPLVAPSSRLDGSPCRPNCRPGAWSSLVAKWRFNPKLKPHDV